jgi:DNA repair exonuclease SbcCD ATPase subunit
MRKEIAELQKINDRLEQELYKYQYDVNRVTDVLLNNAYPSKEELEHEENGIEEMSDQERHLYSLLKQASTLRKTQTTSIEKLKVYEKDIEELMNKNKKLQETEHIKNELANNLELEQSRNVELEAILCEKDRSFNVLIGEKDRSFHVLIEEKDRSCHVLIEEKDNLLDGLAKIQAEKDELKGTLDTLHQLRDQEEEEIEKTLDEAKSIIQKLEEKLHNKDEKIKKYKDKVANLERDKSEIETKLNIIEDEFKDKEKNMKLKLLWAQMEKKDLATTILKLESGANSIQQSDIKGQPSHYGKSFDERRRNSHSEEKATANRSRYNPDLKRNSEVHFGRESMEEARSGSRNRASLRRKHVDHEHEHHMHERSKSAISFDSQGPTTKLSEFHLQNQAMPDCPDVRYSHNINYI